MSALARRGLMRPARGPFAFPGTNPGFDPTHIASDRARFSGVAVPGNFLNLLSGVPGTLTNVPTTSVDSNIGTCFKTSAGNQNTDFSGQSTNNDTSVTVGFMMRPRVSNANQPVFASDSANANGFFVAMDQSPKLLIQAINAATFKESSFTYTAGVPYFCIISMNGTATTNFLAVRLDTGQVFFSTTTGLSLTAPNGTYRIGRNNTFHLNGSSLAAVMFAARFMSASEMSLWASNPWSFWYPKQ